MPRWPFHKYLGPGNSLDEGPPVNRADYIARHHDEHYEFEPEAAREADEEAIQQFLHGAFESSDISNFYSNIIGAGGLSIKKRVEDRVGQIYPKRYAESKERTYCW